MASKVAKMLACRGGGHVRRSERLIRITKYLLDRPNCAVSLSELADGMEAAKSSVSEDVAMVRDVLAGEETGVVQTIAGAGGGVKFQVRVPAAVREAFEQDIIQRLGDVSRILPGGFLYMSDVLGDPDVLDFSGRLLAERFAESGVNVVVTVETKGIPIAVATARYLHVPVVVVRREHRVTDGAAVSVHYVSGSAKRIQTMSVSKRAMPQHAKALIVDDFMRAGATVQTVKRLLAEFDAEVLGTAVFMSTLEPALKLVDDYISLFSVGPLQEDQEVLIVPGNAKPD
ncbi:pur operon repressor [Alicyclobacillus pomorum]|jgi:purine operon repressor